MEKRKTIVDREPLSSEYIKGKENFDHVLKSHLATKTPLWKSGWFYGPVGLAVIAVAISIIKFNSSKESNDNTATLKTTLVQQASAIGDVPFNKKTRLAVNQEAKPKNELNETASEQSEGRIEERETHDAEVWKSVEVIEDETRLMNVVEVEEAVDESTKTVDEAAEYTGVGIPEIGGVQLGKIDVSKLEANPVLECSRPDWKITGFSIQYDDGIGIVVDQVQGDRIPNYVMNKLKRFNLNSRVDFTHIQAIDPSGARKSLQSMTIQPER